MVCHGVKDLETDPKTQSYFTLPVVNSSEYFDCLSSAVLPSVYAHLKCMLGPTTFLLILLQESYEQQKDLLPNSLPEESAGQFLKEFIFLYQSVGLWPLIS
jgi:hypothetical protein